MNAVDCHLHAQSAAEAEILLRAMDQAGIEKAVLMGSPRFTITLRVEDGFTQYHENNLELLKTQKMHPDRFTAWPTLDPLAAGNIARLEDYVRQGATGLKLYVGHGFSFGTPPRFMFHTTAIDSAPLKPVYQFCSANRLPVCLHINTTDNAPGFREEFERVLVMFPDLRILAPHWMLAARRPRYLRAMLQRYPNLMTDISFGQDAFLEAGLQNISKNAAVLKQLVMDFSTRVLFGTDLVCTNAPQKNADWMIQRMMAYKWMLESEHYTCPLTHEIRTGLYLPEPVLSRVRRENALKLLNYSSEKR